MAADAATLARVKRAGLGVLAPASGLQVLAAVLAGSARGSPTTFVAVPVSWDTLLRGKQPPFFFSDFAPQQLESPAKVGSHGGA